MKINFVEACFILLYILGFIGIIAASVILFLHG